MSENPQIRPPVETLVRGLNLTQLIVSHAMRATSCRGGSRGLRPFRRGRGGEEHRYQAKQAMAWQEACKLYEGVK